MKYMLLIYGAEDCWTEDERKDCMIAGSMPPAMKGTVEIRPLFPLPKVSQDEN